MRTIIIGAGEVGYQVAKYLAIEGVEVVLIDKDGNKLKKIAEELDVGVIEAEGGDPNALKKAGADNADLLLAVTNSDETNMIACLLAKSMFNVKKKIARIRNPDYYFNKILLSKENLDIDSVINPELEAANAIIRLLEIPFASEVLEFERGKVLIIAYKIPENSYLIGKKLKELRSSIKKDFIIGIIVRDEEVIIPRGEDYIKQGDLIYLLVKKEDINEIAKIFGEAEKIDKKIMIVGGGRIAFYIASNIEEKAEIKIIEKNSEKCRILSEKLNNSLVLCGDGTDKNLLLQENIQDMDVFIATSHSDELNIMSCLLAKKLGVRRTIAIVNKSEYVSLAHHLGIQSVINPRLLTASMILRYIRKGQILSLSAIGEHEAEIMEVELEPISYNINKPLEKIKFPKNTIIGIIIRGKKIILPSGKDILYEKDRVIFFTHKDSIKSLEKLLK